MTCPLTVDQLKKANVAVSEKDVLRPQDVFCLKTNGDPTTPPFGFLHDCQQQGGPLKITALTPVQITELFKCPEHVEEIKIFEPQDDEDCTKPIMKVLPATYEVFLPDGDVVVVSTGPLERAVVKNVAEEILGYRATFATNEVTLAHIHVRTYGEKRVEIAMQGEFITPENPLPVTGMDVGVDITSFERGGDDSVSADENARRDLDAVPSQESVSGIDSDLNTIPVADRSKLFAKLVAAKIFGVDENGNLQLLSVQTDGTLNIKGVVMTAFGSVTALDGSANRFYGDATTLVSAVGAFGAANPFGFSAIAIVVACDAGQSVEVSFDGVAVHGKINAGESFTYFPKKETDIYFKKAVVGTTFRVWAW